MVDRRKGKRTLSTAPMGQAANVWISLRFLAGWKARARAMHCYGAISPDEATPQVPPLLLRSSRSSLQTDAP
jgi:hypothetical protein